MHITYEQADPIIDAAITKAKEAETPNCVAVVDSGGNLNNSLVIAGIRILFAYRRRGKPGEINDRGLALVRLG